MSKKAKSIGKTLYRKWWGIGKEKDPHRAGIVLGVIVGALGFAATERMITYLWTKNQLASTDHQAIYLLGQQQAKRVDFVKLTPGEASIFALGFQDQVARGKSQVSSESIQLQKWVENRQASQISVEKKAGQEYLTRFVRAGGMRSLSGLAYKLVTPGSEKKPTLKDWVEVKYQARLIHGTIVDGTPGSGESAKFPLNGVIAGWSEGLQLVGEGGEIELVVPSELAYGDQGTHAGVPPGSTLVFHIQLLKVIDNGLKSSSGQKSSS